MMYILPFRPSLLRWVLDRIHINIHKPLLSSLRQDWIFFLPSGKEEMHKEIHNILLILSKKTSMRQDQPDEQDCLALSG